MKEYIDSCKHEPKPDSMTGYCNCPVQYSSSDLWWDEFSFGEMSDKAGELDFDFDKWFIKKHSIDDMLKYEQEKPLLLRLLKVKS